MDPAFLNTRFFQHFDPARWEDEPCADLAPVVRLLLAKPGNAIASMGLENIKAPDLTVLLLHPPSYAAFAEVAALCAENAKLRARAGSVVCFEHYHAVEWDLPQPPSAPTKPSLIKRLFG